MTAGWSSYGGSSYRWMVSTIIVEAFGRLLPHGDIGGIDTKEEDLYSVFNNRAEIMNWSTTALPRPEHPLLWGMNEAELTPDSGNTIGFVQVGTKANIAVILVPLIQCFADALQRFGDAELSGLQVTGNLLPDTAPRLSEPNWFNMRPGSRASALITWSQGLLGDGNTLDFATGLSGRNGAFQYLAPVQAPDGSEILAETSFIPVSRNSDGLGIPVVLPEWTASAIAWAMATVADAALLRNPNVRNLAIRLTRS